MLAKTIAAKIWLISLVLGVNILTQAKAIALVNFPNIGKIALNNIALNQSAISTDQPQSLIQKGRDLYQSGAYAEAIKVWQAAVQTYQTQGDVVNQAMVLSNISMGWQGLGQWSQATDAITQSLQLIDKVKGQERGQIFAQILNSKGSLELAIGKPQAALDTWQLAQQAYEQAGNNDGIIRSQINQSLALQELGLYRRSLKNMQALRPILEQQPDSLLKLAGLRSLGTSMRVVGNLNDSRAVFLASLELAKRLQSPENIAQVLLDLGNTVQFQKDDQAALKFYQESASTSQVSSTRVEALLNIFEIFIEHQQWEEAANISSEISPLLTDLPTSHNSIYARINFADSLFRIYHKDNNQNQISGISSYPEIGQLLAKAIKEAQTLGDQRGQSYGLGELGKLYEYTQQWAEAQEVTQQALVIAQAINAPDIAYRWQWQLGRILKARGKNEAAIAAYTESVSTLKSIRSDLVSINTDLQFSFRETVEPVYRELVALLLANSEISNQKQNQKNSNSSQVNLNKARQVIESLQLAELDNFFREACLVAKSEQIDQIDSSAAIIYPIILSDRLEVVVSLPNQPLRHYQTYLSRAEVEDVLSNFRQQLVTRSSRDFFKTSQKIYNWLIRPIETQLATSGVKTLAFVPDGFFRNVPMGALYDGKQYLIEKYSIAITSGLQLIDPKPLLRGQLKVLTAGLTKANQGFPALPNVAKELEKIKLQLPTELFLNQQFTSAALQKEIGSSPFPIIHLATHGQFSSNAEDTFILTWDHRINVTELNTLLRSSEGNKAKAIELLVLSACQTAAGDNRAALGLAGVALRAGARSTLASLWYIDDGATVPLMAEFYKQLSDAKVTKAEALRRAQISLLKNPEYEHPIYWAPYVLVGNWL